MRALINVVLFIEVSHLLGSTEDCPSIMSFNPCNTTNENSVIGSVTHLRTCSRPCNRSWGPTFSFWPVNTNLCCQPCQFMARCHMAYRKHKCFDDPRYRATAASQFCEGGGSQPVSRQSIDFIRLPVWHCKESNHRPRSHCLWSCSLGK